MKKASYNYCNNLTKSSKKNKKEIEDMVNNFSSDVFEKKENKVKKFFNSMIETNYYLELLLQYLVDNKMTFYDYYSMVANNYCNNKEVPDFENRNPFIKENGVNYLIESNNKDEINRFALQLSRTVESFLTNK